MTGAFYDELAAVYDRMIRWERRLAMEAPWFEAIWRATGALRVLDAACGSGGHLPMWVEQGRDVTASDASETMLEMARGRIETIDPARRPRLVRAAWNELAEKIPRTFDAVLCLGNSLPYVAEADELSRSLAGLWSRVAPGGFLLIQFKNFERLRRRGERFLPMQSRIAPDGGEQIALRQYNWGGQTVEFVVILLTRAEGDREWTLRHWTTPLAAWTPAQVAEPLHALGAEVTLYGSLNREPFSAENSEDAVLWATRPSTIAGGGIS